LESTTYPGTTEDVILPYLNERGLAVGVDYALVYSPEREDPGNKNFSVSSIPKLVGGVTPSCTDLGSKLYGETVATVIPVKNPRIAEMAKLLENVHRAVNIGLVNELKPLATALDIDIFDVIAAASTKPFGFVPYYPGPGLGGHCIPIDPFYLTWKAHEYDIHTRFIELAGEINACMPSYVVKSVISELNSRGKPLQSSVVLCLGLAYKKDFDDIRESPSLKVIQILLNSGASVLYHDPYCRGVTNHPMFGGRSIDEVILSPEIVQSADLTLLLTDHTCFDYAMVYEYSDVIVDTRGKYPLDGKVVRS
jgi:UDP-N-acetyl-D-glucosamine dehydrogenase